MRNLLVSLLIVLNIISCFFFFFFLFNFFFQNICEALSFLLDKIFIQFGTKLYKHIVRIHMYSNFAPLVCFLFCYDGSDR